MKKASTIWNDRAKTELQRLELTSQSRLRQAQRRIRKRAESERNAAVKASHTPGAWIESLVHSRKPRPLILILIFGHGPLGVL